MAIFNSYVSLPEGKQNGTSPFSMGGLVRWKNHRTIAGRLAPACASWWHQRPKIFIAFKAWNLLRNVVNPMINSWFLLGMFKNPFLVFIRGWFILGLTWLWNINPMWSMYQEMALVKNHSLSLNWHTRCQIAWWNNESFPLYIINTAVISLSYWLFLGI